MSAPMIPKPAGGDQDRGGAVIAIYWALAVAAIAVVGLRFYSRRLIRATGIDDWVMLIGLFFQVVLSGFCTYEARIGGFKHLYYLSSTQTTEAIKWNYILQCWGITAFTAPKLSVGLLIIRILSPIRGWRFWTICSIMTVMFIGNTLDSIFTYVQCNPARALWDHSVPAKCWNPTVQTNFSIFQASVNVFTDTVFALLPSTIIWGLNMPKSQRIGLCFLLGPGLFAAIAGIVKITYLRQLNAHSDITWETYSLVVWSGAENFVVLVCGSVPTMKPLYDKYLSRKQIYGSGHSRLNEGYHNNYNLNSNATPSKVSRDTTETLESHIPEVPTYGHNFS